MPKITKLQTSFTTGEISPLMYGRTEAERYAQALLECLNYIPTLQGPLIRRPATKLANLVKDSAKPGALVPFVFSQSQAYVFEFGDKYIRFYANGGEIVTTGSSNFALTGYDSNTGLFPFTSVRTSSSPNSGETVTNASSVISGVLLELVSPYSYLDVPNIRFAQSQDTIYLTHPSYPPYKLQRLGQTSWDLKRVYNRDGPYLPLNSYAQTGDSTTIGFTASFSGQTITLTTAPQYAVLGAVNNGSGAIRLTTAAHTYKTGDRVAVSGVVGTTEANNALGSGPIQYWPITVINSTHFDLTGSTFTNPYVSGGGVVPALFASTTNFGGDTDDGRAMRLINTQWGSSFALYGTINVVNAAGSIQMTTSRDNPTTNVNSSLISNWQLGAWSPALGYPAACCFHQNRLMFAGVANFPQRVDGSYSGDYENFQPNDPLKQLNTTDSNAISFNLNSQELNAIQWVKSSSQGLLAGTQASEWTITPSSQASALTPTNFNALQSSFFGSANVDATQAGAATVHVQRAGRKVRELNYFFQFGTFRSTDLSELSEHITLPTVKKLVTQKETQPLVWGIRSDGNLVSMVYNRDDVSLKAGWSRHQLGGQSDAGGTNPKVLSAAVIPSQDGSFDQLWLMVQRSNISGSSYVSIEYMTKPFDDSMNQEDAFQGDCGATYDNPVSISAISTVFIVNCAAVFTTSTSHGFSTGDQLQVKGVIGVNTSIIDVNGNKSTTGLFNYGQYSAVVANSTQFEVADLNTGAIISAIGYTPYVGSGQVRKMVKSISGLDWLNGETVGVLTDGSPHPDVIVQSNAITLNYRAATVQIGYRFNSDGQTLRQEGGSAEGSGIGQTRRVHRVAAQFHRTGDFQMGATFTDLAPVEFQRSDQDQLDMATPLFSGMHRDGIGGPYDFDGYVCFRQNSMLPGMVQSLTIFMEEQDV